MPASLIQHFLCHPWHNISRFKHSSALVCHGQVLLHSFKNEAMGTRENHDTPNLNPEVAMAWSWYVEIQLLLPWTTWHYFPVLRREPALSWHHWLHSLTLHGQPGAKGEAPTAHRHTCRHACTSSLQLYSKPTQIMKIIDYKDTNPMKNQENTVKLL